MSILRFVPHDFILQLSMPQHMMVFIVDMLHKKDDEIKMVCDHKNQLMVELLEVYDIRDQSKVIPIRDQSKVIPLKLHRIMILTFS